MQVDNSQNDSRVTCTVVQRDKRRDGESAAVQTLQAVAVFL